MDPKKIGYFGEKIAADYLKGKGYQILERNYKKDWSSVKKGEIDIICQKGEVISFVEVKTVRQPFSEEYSFLPEDKVDFNKKRKLVMLAETWLAENEIPFDTHWQIDVLAIRIDQKRKKARISFFQNVVEG